MQRNLPTVPIHDLAIKNDDLIVATHGRSFWVLDDITPLRQLDATTADASAHLFTPSPAYRMHYPDQVDSRHPVGENPPSGAIIDYYLKDAPKGEVTIQIYDSKGKLVRRLSSVENQEDIQPPEWPDQVREVKTIPTAAGLNRYVWNLRYDDPVKVPGAFYSGNGPRGPLAIPGKYEIRLSYDGKTQTAPLEIVADPRVKLASADFEKQFDLSNQVYQSVSTLHGAINQIRDLKAQIQLLDKRFQGDAKMQAMLKAADNLAAKLSAVEEKMIQVNMKGSEANLAFPNMLNEELDSFASSVESADAAPTAQQYQIYKILSGKLEAQMSLLDQIISTDVTGVSDAAKKENVPVLQVPKIKR